MIEWEYKSKEDISTGYEDIMTKINIIKPEEFNKLSTEAQDDVVNSIFNAIRSKNIFPIMYFNEEGINKEIMDCIKKEVTLKENKLTFNFNQGQHLCRFLFPSLHTVHVNGRRNMSMHERFYNDNSLKKTIKFVLKFEEIRNIYSGIYRTSKLIEHGSASNFPPMRAKAIYEKYCPQNGTIYDYACGFGGRMIGALCSKNNYRYFGVEPNTETFESLNKLGGYIEKATNRENIFRIYCQGSEDFKVKNECADFAFSSPPYYDLEIYSDEETQCYNKFKTLDEWFNGYAIPTIQNTYDMLKLNSYYAVNIADFKIGKTVIKYVDKWVEESTKIGFQFVEKIDMKIQSKRGDGHKIDENEYKVKEEGIYVFKK